MKRFLITIVALLLIVIVDASNTTTSTITASNIEHSVTAPEYWSGWAWEKGGMPNYSLYITVYRTAYQCDAYYARASKMRYHTYSIKEYAVSAELTVKEDNNGGYYVTYEGRNFYFNM